MTRTGSENMDRPDPADFGILDGISEVIATTRSDAGTPNAAPIGIIRDRDRLCVQLFSGSHTRQNAAGTGNIVANIIHDPVMYVECTFGDPDPEAFEYPGGMDYPVLKRASAWILFECSQSKDNMFELTPICGMIRDKPIFCINRGANSVIEALVHATRYRLNGDAQYLDLIRHYDRIVQRCGGSAEKDAIARLKEIMEIR
ncbi:MAG: hypothetical protein C5S48_02490 [Candidatus Methanogaster sp.]|nr:MAG: hypothetical protein C5S48_02490 [ANME-2 cluster archaeon]